MSESVRRIATLVLVTSGLTLTLALGIFLNLDWARFRSCFPDSDSVFGLRAKTIDGQLHAGMGSAAVQRVFWDDVRSYPADLDEIPGPSWPGEIDLTVNDPTWLWLNPYDTQWTVRVGFDRRDKLVWHRVDVGYRCRFGAQLYQIPWEVHIDRELIRRERSRYRG